MQPQVLIVGAGPTGLALALGLEKQGIPFRIIDKNKGPGEASRAMTVHARILEFYHQFGFVDEIVHSGIPVQQVEIYKDNKQRAKMNLGCIGKGLSPFPYVLSLPQDEHERILINQLKAKGICIEWDTKLISFHQEEDRVHVITTKQGIEKKHHYAYLCGCDGAHSSVRKGLGFDFAGGTYEQVFYVADVLSETHIEGLQMKLFKDGFGLIFPIRTTNSLRLISLVPQALLDKKSEINFTEIVPYIEANLGVHTNKVNLFSTYKVHHRVSEHFRKGRVFIAGDAGHVHSPAGGQGMNTGIGDAINLSWKLAAVLKEKAKEELLDSYEEERMDFAKNLVATTDRMFSGIVGKGFSTKMIREVLIPYIVPKMTGISSIRKALFKAVSQIRIHYRNSMLSTGMAGAIHGGDRLPWVQGQGGDNFKPLQTFDWQFHVYGEVKVDLRELAKTATIPLHEFPWTASMREAGMSPGSMFLIRPDGYVALADSEQDIEKIKAYLNKIEGSSGLI